MTEPNTKADDGSVRLTLALAAQGKGALAAIETIAEKPADCAVTLVKLDASGAKPKAVETRAVDTQLAETGIPALAGFGGRDPLVSAWNAKKDSDVLALAGGKSKVSIAIGDAKGQIVQTADDGTFVAALCETRRKGEAVQTLAFAKISLKAPKFKSVEVKPLNLGGYRVITAIAVWKNALYVAVSDTIAGCDVFRVDLNSRKLVAEPVFERGGFRFSLNAAVPCFMATNDALLFGTAALATSAPRTGRWGCELVAIDGDGAWSLVFGQQRFTPVGLKQPGSGQGAGFGSNDNSALKALAVGPGKAGRVFAVLQDYRGDTENDREGVRPDMFAYDGKVRVVASVAGKALKEWEEIAVDLPEASGAVTSLCATGSVLIIGHEQLGSDGDPFTVVALT